MGTSLGLMYILYNYMETLGSGSRYLNILRILGTKAIQAIAFWT